MALSPGSRLGPYEILSLLGEGGMGEVYRARDTRLERVVAIKILPLHLSDDSQRRQRLEQEARAISSLNHPHICALYDIGHHQESDYLVMEYLEGQTLADRLAKGPFSASQLLRYATEIADALDTAHRRGVIHRDLKPGNVMLTKSGAKLLDFGLAKLQESPARSGISNLSAIPTSAGQPLTAEGTILGTLYYMSPEQLEGKEADERSDIFAFGAIVYEMATGKKAFEAKSQASLIAAVLEHDPPSISSLQPMTPAALDHLVTVCLAKDPDDRWQSAHDIKNEIQWIEATGSQAGISGPTTPRAKSRERFWVAATLILAAIVAAPLLWRNVSEGSTGSPIKPIRVQRLTDFAGLEEFPAISPDGKSVAFAADTGGKWQIWVRLLAGGPPLQITHDPVNHQFPRWSMLSNSLIYFTAPVGSELQGTVWEISALGGAPHRLVDSLEGADLSHDGKKIAFIQPNSEGVQIAVSPLDVYTPHAVARLAPGYKYSYIRWSPDDKWLSYQRETIFESDIFAVPSQGGDPFPITHEGTLMRGFCWLPDSSGIIYSSARGNTILYLPTFNLWTISLGKSVPRQLTFGEASYVHPDLKSGGALVASRISMKFDIWKFPTDGTPSDNVRRGVRITEQTGQVQTPSISPDNKELVYLSDSGGHGNLWVTKLDGSGARQITYERDADVAIGVPVWSPAGKDIAFVSTRNLQGWDFGLWLVSSDGSNVRNVAQRGGWGCWSPDGHFLYYAVSRNGKYQIEKITANGGSPAIVRTDNALSPAVDSNGVLYYAIQFANINGISNFEIRAARPESGPSQLLAQIPGWRIPAWQPAFSQVLSPDGKWLIPIMLSDGPVSNIWALPTAGGPMRQLTDFAQRRTFIARRVSWSSDSKYIFAALGEGDSDVVLLEEILPRR
ncbi:MAG TPA: protein kinase [Acidobacteriota bacterium]|jgi:serine/threonine protein kinase